MSQIRYFHRLKNSRIGRLVMFSRSFTTISVGDNGVIVKKPRMGISKNSLFAIFSRLRRVVTRWIIASYNIAFSKLPLKTEVFRGSLKTASLGKLFFFRLVRQAALVHYAHFALSLSPVMNQLCPFFCCFKSCKIQSFQQSLVAWEHTAPALPVFGNWDAGFQSHSWCK